MRKAALVSISLFTLAGIASAQTPPAPAKGAPAAPAKGAPAAPAEKKAPPPAEKPAAPPAAAQPAGPPKPPEVPAELVDLTKKMAGTWKCTGQSNVMEQMIDVKATITHKADTTLNKFYIQSSFTGTAAKLPPMKSVWYTTYDATSKKLWRVMLNARGGHGTASGTVADTKITWEGEARWPGGVDVKTRTTEEMVSPKEVKVTGEASKDGGKTWTKEVEATCKK